MRPMIANEVNTEYQASGKPKGFQGWLNSFSFAFSFA